MNQADVGNRIAKIRKEKGLTQLQLAEKLNVSNRTVSKWENGDGYPDIEILPKLSNVLNISIDELICGERICDRTKIQANTNESLDKSTTVKSGSSVFKIVSFGLVITATIIGIVTETALYNYRIFLFPIEIYIVIAVAVIIASGVIMYCCYNSKCYKNMSSFDKSDYRMTVLAFAFPVFLFFRISQWIVSFPIGYIALFLYIITTVSLFFILKKRQKKKQ